MEIQGAGATFPLPRMNGSLSLATHFSTANHPPPAKKRTQMVHAVQSAVPAMWQRNTFPTAEQGSRSDLHVRTSRRINFLSILLFVVLSGLDVVPLNVSLVSKLFFRSSFRPAHSLRLGPWKNQRRSRRSLSELFSLPSCIFPTIFGDFPSFHANLSNKSIKILQKRTD